MPILVGLGLTLVLLYLWLLGHWFARVVMVLALAVLFSAALRFILPSAARLPPGRAPIAMVVSPGRTPVKRPIKEMLDNLEDIFGISCLDTGLIGR